MGEEKKGEMVKTTTFPFPAVIKSAHRQNLLSTPNTLVLFRKKKTARLVMKDLYVGVGIHVSSRLCPNLQCPLEARERYRGDVQPLDVGLKTGRLH